MRRPAKLLVALLASGLGTGCASDTLRQTRARLAAHDRAGALEAAGAHPAALQEIALSLLTAALFEDDAPVEAAEGLRQAGFLAHDRLRRLMQEPNSHASSLAAGALAAQGDRRARAFLVARLDGPQAFVRAVALRTVGKHETSLPQVRAALDEPSELVRAAALTVLGQLDGDENPWVVSLLVRSWRQDPVPRLQAQALRLLGRLAPDEVRLEAARTALNRPEMVLRMAALDVLGHLEDRTASQALLLQRLGTEDLRERVRAATLLATQGNSAGVQVLAQLLVEGGVSSASAAALGAAQVGEPLRADLLRALQRPEPEVRLYVGEALWRQDETRARQALQGLLDGPTRLALSAAAVLSRNAESSGMLQTRARSWLTHPEPSIRGQAAALCGAMDHGFRIVAPAMNDSAPTVQVAAARAVLASLRRRR